MKYRSFVTAPGKAHERAGGTADRRGPGAPAAATDGRRVRAVHNGGLSDAGAFEDLLRDVHSGPRRWEEGGPGPG